MIRVKKVPEAMPTRKGSMGILDMPRRSRDYCGAIDPTTLSFRRCWVHCIPCKEKTKLSSINGSDFHASDTR
jgi:hypothetical protein